jgi:hypothetical protein
MDTNILICIDRISEGDETWTILSLINLPPVCCVAAS